MLNGSSVSLHNGNNGPRLIHFLINTSSYATLPAFRTAYPLEREGGRVREREREREKGRERGRGRGRECVSERERERERGRERERDLLFSPNYSI